METAEDIGIVTSVEGDQVTVEITKGGGCKSCSMKGFCGGNVSKVVLNFRTDDVYQIGDRVKVEVSAGIRVLSSLLVFGLPLVSLFAFFLLGRLFMAEPLAVLIGFAGLLLAFLIIRLLDKKIASRIEFQLGGKCDDLPE